MSYLQAFDSILKQTDPALHRHFAESQLGPETYLWLPIRSLFTELLTRKEWLQLFDHVFTLPPSFIGHFAVAYLAAPAMRANLLRIEPGRKQDFLFVLQWCCGTQRPTTAAGSSEGCWTPKQPRSFRPALFAMCIG